MALTVTHNHVRNDLANQRGFDVDSSTSINSLSINLPVESLNFSSFIMHATAKSGLIVHADGINEATRYEVIGLATPGHILRRGQEGSEQENNAPLNALAA